MIMKKLIVPTEMSITANDWKHYLSLSPWRYVRSIRDSLINDNRFFVDEQFIKLIFWYAYGDVTRQFAIKKIPQGAILFRARIFDKNLDLENNRGVNSAFRGYDKENSFVPPNPALVGEGRANPANIVYLYTASDEYTAIAEVNPNLGEDVSVAKIKVKEDLFLLNLAKFGNIFEEMEEEEMCWLRAFISEVGSIFQTPYRNKYDYLFCQYISELAKNMKLDGITFCSSKLWADMFDDSGINFTIFNYDKCEAISSKLVMITNIGIDYQEKA